MADPSVSWFGSEEFCNAMAEAEARGAREAAEAVVAKGEARKARKAAGRAKRAAAGLEVFGP